MRLEGYFISIEGQFEAQEQATRLIGGLSLISLALISWCSTAATSRRGWRR